MTPQHQQGIDLLAADGFAVGNTGHFFTIARRCLRDGWGELAEGVGQLQRIYPDGFKIDRPSRTLIAGEIEHQHPVKGGRLKTYARLWHLFDAHDRWSFRLLVMDTRDYHLRELDLSVIWINGLAGDDIVSSRGGLRTTAAAKACSCGAAWGHKPACALRLGA